MVKIVQAIYRQVNAATDPARLEKWLPWLLFGAAIFVLFYQLGQAALFEPDEGRNAEKAREILVFDDWVTPQENFHPVLDKPIFFYWSIALSYRLFGISEWAARLPSALAALISIAANLGTISSLVLMAGFFPWTLLLPVVALFYRRAIIDDRILFLILWIALPFLFFSLSKSKLPHYILPIFPPLAILTSVPLVQKLRVPTTKFVAALHGIWIAEALTVIYFVVGARQPAILHSEIRTAVINMSGRLWLYGVSIVLVPLLLLFSRLSGKLPRQPRCFFPQAVSALLVLFCAAELMVATAPFRSVRALAHEAAPAITPTTQVVFYDSYLAGMGFYLATRQPFWVITHGKKKRTF